MIYYLLIKLKEGININAKTILIFSLLLIGVFYTVDTIRSSERAEFKKINFVEKIVYTSFGEWREYSYIINKFQNTKTQFLGGKIFYGVVAPVLPKEVYQIIGIDKETLLADNAAEYLGRYFGHYAGIRIGVVGESYVGFGIRGVIVFMMLLGFVFAYVEKKYLILNLNDVRLSGYVFLLSLFFFLPLLTFINFTTIGIFFGFFLILIMIFCRS